MNQSGEHLRFLGLNLILVLIGRKREIDSGKRKGRKVVSNVPLLFEELTQLMHDSRKPTTNDSSSEIVLTHAEHVFKSVDHRGNINHCAMLQQQDLMFKTKKKRKPLQRENSKHGVGIVCVRKYAGIATKQVTTSRNLCWTNGLIPLSTQSPLPLQAVLRDVTYESGQSRRPARTTTILLPWVRHNVTMEHSLCVTRIANAATLSVSHTMASPDSARAANAASLANTQAKHMDRGSDHQDE
ncbi:hypothetical protein WN51_13838 [Melipona quadrifasciata]|uniref:Uncharacterized protein n=1 Tax=Melipona quadrifasciata TaxID=166423 RepID=A0A0M8ZYL6_9HYME|nr:hypothetical protein WN51_13838 [Melipona quadrifasciata]